MGGADKLEEAVDATEIGVVDLGSFCLKHLKHDFRFLKFNALQVLHIQSPGYCFCPLKIFGGGGGLYCVEGADELEEVVDATEIGVVDLGSFCLKHLKHDSRFLKFNTLHLIVSPLFLTLSKLLGFILKYHTYDHTTKN